MLLRGRHFSRYWEVFHIYKLNDVAIDGRSFPIYISQNVNICEDNRSPRWSNSIYRMLPVLVRKFEPRLLGDFEFICKNEKGLTFAEIA